jgi:hypothetical protein
MTRLVQLKQGVVRRVALVEEPHLRLLDGCGSVYDLARTALATGVRLSDAARQRATAERLDYNGVYTGRSGWHLLPPIDHPEPARCLVSGTGLTHLGSARDRQSMHAANSEELTDSMKMFRWGVEGGRPEPGKIGTAPEWFYKGTGTTLRAHGEPLDVPSYAEDGGEEAEIAGIYLIAADGTPRRMGMASGNEFSDHRFEKKNYLNLAGSKLRTCALGPELVVDPEFQSVSVEVNIERNGGVLWSTKFRTGEDEMCHSLQNMEHHHFKFASHRRPGDIHVHFFGTECLSFGAGIQLENGDVMQVAFEGFGRPLRNPVHVEASSPSLIQVTSLG